MPAASTPPPALTPVVAAPTAVESLRERLGMTAHTPVEPVEPSRAAESPPAAAGAGAQPGSDGMSTDLPAETGEEPSGDARAGGGSERGGTAGEAPRGELSLEDARALFRQIYEAAKSTRSAIQGFLNSGCDIIAIDRHTITLGFEFAWIPEKLLPGTQAHRALSAVVEEVLGGHFEVQCVHAPGVENRLRASPPRPSHLADEARRLGLPRIERGPVRP